MAVLFTRQKLDEQKARLDSVRSVGQAWAAIVETQSLANMVHDEIRQTLFEDSWRTQARKDIRDYQATLTREAKALLGASPTASAVQAWKGGIRDAVSRLWFHSLLVQGQFPPNETTAMQRLSGKVAVASDALNDAIRNAPDLVLETSQKVQADVTRNTRKLIKGVATVVKEGVRDASDIALQPVSVFKWYLLGIGAIVAVSVGTYFLLVRKIH